jgi:hypothetical protein
MDAWIPFNTMSREAVDAENARVRGAVISLIRDKDGRPFPKGSAVAIDYLGCKCLLTALHVFEHTQGSRLLLFAFDGYTRAPGDRIETSVKFDIAAVRLDDEGQAALSHIPFVTSADLGSAAGTGERFHASVAGYPHRATRLIDRMSLDARMDVYSGMARDRPGGTLSVDFDKKRGGWSRVGHGDVRDPKGKSGGAILGMPLAGPIAVQLGARTKLVGVPTVWRGKEIIGAGVASLVQLLASLTDGA